MPKLTSFASLSLAALALVTAALADSPASFLEALGAGKFSGSARYRYEIYDQDSVPGATTVAGGRIDGTAIASTVRLMLGYRSVPYYGLSVYADVESIHALGWDEHYRLVNHPELGNRPYAIIADPQVTSLNQAYMRWNSLDSPVDVVVGREAYALNNGRFISFSGWRQDNQTIDLARASLKVGGGLAVHYAYLDKVHRVVGREASDGRLGMDSHVLHANFARPGLNASLYGIWLDYDLPSQAANDTQSIGLRLSGPYKLNDDLSLVYTADYAHQSDQADNPLSVSLDYWQLEFGVDVRGQRLFAGWTVLEGKRGAAFRTPLAHPHNGWTEKFLNTPVNGLEAFYVTATGSVPGVAGLAYTATGYDYRATTGGAHYGSELDLALEWKAKPLHQNLTLGWRFGNYFADDLLTDSLRTSVYGVFTF